MRSTALFVTTEDPASVQSWSGTPHFMLSALRQLADVDVLVLPKHAWLGRIEGLVGRLAGRRPELQREPLLLRTRARLVERALRRRRYDFAFSPSSTAIASVRTRVPLVFWTDAVFGLLVESYASGTRYTRRARRVADAQERSSLHAAARAGYSSEWSLEGARRLVPEARMRLAEFGPNLEKRTVDEVRRQRGARKPDGILRLLWIGVDWERKGGGVAAAATARLAAAGHEVELHLVGALPEHVPSGAIAHGRLSKSDPVDLRTLARLLGAADVLMLPSRGDCTPIVVSEAAAIGLPAVVSDVGGLGEMVRRHGMGLTVPIDADEADRTAAAVLEVVRHRRRFEAAALEAASSLDYVTGFRRLLGDLLETRVRAAGPSSVGADLVESRAPARSKS